MSSDDNSQPSDSQPSPTPTPRFVGLRYLFRSFSTPDAKPSTIPPEPDLEQEPPRPDSPDDNKQTRTKDEDGAESVASPTPLQRFWRHARTKTTGPEEFPPPRWLAPEPNVVTEHASPSPTLSRSPSSAADELEAVSPMPTTLITSPERIPDSTPLGEREHPSPSSLAQRIHSIISSTPTAMYQPMVLGSPTTPVDGRTLPQSPVQGPSSLLSPVADSRLLSFLYSPKLMNSPGPGQPSVFSMLERLQSPRARNHELPPEGGNEGQGGDGMEVADDGSSLMLCSPLIPQRDSLVEIAETEYVSFDEAGRVIAESHRSPLHQVYTVDDIDEGIDTDDDEMNGGAHQTTGGGGEAPSQVAEESFSEDEADDGEGLRGGASEGSKSIFRWPWTKTEEEKQVEQKAKEVKKLAETKAKEERRLKKKNEKLMWVPSPTKISLQTMWWGYRMSVDFQIGGSMTN
jgi:hypothetical protein